MTREALGEFEHQVMLALLLLCEPAHSAPVVLELEARTGRSVSPAAVFVALRRLEQRGYVRSKKLAAEPGAGGRGRRLFTVTREGLARVRESRRAFENLWRDLAPLLERR
jgi:DNA-binding PadR family transcriptional regulator